ncbi:adenosine kinase [Terrarubrum flagellatum]|uniref:adenosine kinase n=1 Tax=Terrirubrum flagellatum TaxID=2895980 RepID=UPI003144DA72
MSEPRHDVLCIGNAIVDVIARTEEDFLVKHQMAKGSMMLIDEERAETLFAAMGPATVISGGSAGNTAVGIASFGGRAACFGKVKDDELGRLFAHDFNSIGVHYPVALATSGPATARSFILVTPDGERTMNTYLGACVTFGPDDVDEETVRSSRISYFEGYLWDPPAAKDAIRKAAAIAHEAGREVAITLSDSFCVDRYREEFLFLMRTRTVDLVFANEHELLSLYQTSDFQSALDMIRKDATTVVVTRSAKGALVATKDSLHEAPAASIRELVDTTGAGDLFASGFLYGRATQRDPQTCLKFGALAAAEVIQHIGARPQTSLREVAEQAGFKL